MKKLVIVIALAAILATGTAFADHPSGFGIGVQGGYGGGWGGGWATSPGVALTLKFPGLPVFWAVDLDIWQSYLGLRVAGDYYFIDKELVSTLHWYLGVGGYVGLGFGTDYFGLGLGARLPIGLSWQPIKLLEIYLQLVPSIGVEFLPNIGLGGGWGANLGVRLWF